MTGLRIEEAGLNAAYAPFLPPNWQSMTLKNVAFRGQRYDIRVDRGSDGKVQLKRTAATEH